MIAPDIYELDKEYNVKDRRKQRLAGILSALLLISAMWIPANAGNTRMRVNRVGIGELPVAFNWRDLGLVTPVKNQSPYNACWAFSATACMEQNILRQEGEVVDLSEAQIGYAIFTNPQVPSPGLEGDRVIYDNTSRPWYTFGGNNVFTLTMLAKGWGPVREEVAPYAFLEQGLSDSVTFRAGDYEVKGIYTYSGNDREGIKEAIEVYGGVTMPVHMKTTGVYRGEGMASYTSAKMVQEAAEAGETIQANHEVCVVGWDDDYPRENFGGEKPKHDGAWLCKNSYGENWGDGGYYWLSYEDVVSNVSGATCYAFELGEVVPLENIYQHDGGGSADSLSLTSAANIFTARNTEKLTAVRVRNCSDFADATISIYTNVEENNPESGTLALSMNVAFSKAGYETVDLSEPVLLGKGQRFSVCVKYEEETKVGIDRDAKYPNVDMEFDITANAGESFCKQGDNGTWKDLNGPSSKEHRNLRIKAIAESFGTMDMTTPDLGVNKTTAGNVRLKWNDVEEAEGYQIYMANDGGEFSLVDTVSEDTTSYLFSNLTPGEVYRFYVEAFGEGYEVSQSPICKLKAPVGTPTGFGLSQKSGVVTLRWNRVKNATGYRIYRRVQGGKYSLLTAVENVKTYKDRTVKRGGTYYYKIKAETGNTLSTFSTYKKVRVSQ